MALPKRYIEIKASSNVRDPLSQGWSDDGNVVELQHFSGMPCSGRELWFHPLQGATSAFGTNRTFRNVHCPVAIRGKADIEQAALSKLDL
jgi:hypothetical protein